MTTRDISPDASAPTGGSEVGAGVPVGAEADWLAGDGEMARLIRAKDWSRTPLGPIQDWPQSLRTTMSICLASNFPINIAWGPERTQIYNDGYRLLCGEKHPEALGEDFKESWASPWPVIGGPFENAAAGRTDLAVNERMFLDRNGYLEETFFTFSFSPIRDESGGVGGLFHPVTELTQQTLVERRLRVVRAIADSTAELTTVAASGAALVSALAAHELDVPFALLYLLDADGGRATLAAATGLEPGTAASPAVVDLTGPEGSADGAADWPIARAARERQPLEVTDLAGRFGPLSCGPYPESPNSAVLLPINLAGPQPFGVLVVGVSARRALDEQYRLFHLMLRESATNALTSARTYEAERSRAEALAELDRAKTEFFSNISHEFRTPLTLMMGPIDQLRADPVVAAEPRLADELDVAHRNGLRLSRLVNTVLDFSRLQAGRMRARFEPVELAAATAELASMFRATVERAGLRLVVDCPPLPGPLWVDRESWERVVLNLLSNAVKFTFTGSISVTVSAVPGGGAALSVTDTGSGIPEAEQDRLFERFHQVRGSRGRSAEGSGIGLALADELVALHGGTITARSRLGVGSTFTVRLPPGYAHLPAEQVTHTAAGAPGPGSDARSFVAEAMRWLPGEALPGEVVPGETGTAAGGRVLVADDNTDMREYLQRLLATRYTVTTVSDGLAALAAARAEPPDLVVSDIMMPGLDGHGLLAELRADPATESVPVLLLSARAGQEAAVEALAAGADDYLVKPFTAAELLARVDAHLRLNRARRENEEIKQRFLAAAEVVRTLQGSLLPEELPVLPGLQLAARYCVADGDQAAGGDWFDAVPLSDGRVALVAGDVVGHGARASAVMGQLRSVLTAYLLDGYEVADALARLDRFVDRLPAATATTVCLAILDPGTGRMSYAASGHPPPLVVSATGDARYLPLRQGAPLGTAGSAAIEQETTLEPGDLLLLYTDGLIERIDRTLSEGLELLRLHTSGAVRQPEQRERFGIPLDRLCQLTLTRMTDGRYNDDVSLIAARRISPVPVDFRADLIADPLILSQLRRNLGQWLTAVGAGTAEVQGIQLAVGEAVTNVIDHGYPGGAGPVVVEAHHDDDGQVLLTVSDQGAWRPPPVDPANRGRGFIMMRACMDTVEVERTSEGTTVLMDLRLRARPVLATARADSEHLPPGEPFPEYRTELARSPRTLLTVRGPIDAGTIAEFRNDIRQSHRGGTMSLHLDLTEVSQLASAGVQTLHELAKQMATDARLLRLIAPLRSPAYQVLELTGLDHLVTREPA